MRSLSSDDIDAVMTLENGAYSFPWSRGNFTDSLAAGHWMDVLEAADGTLRGYFVAMPAADELHLLNLTVAAAWRRRGHARMLLDRLEARARAHGLLSIWLEVRVSNEAARALYRNRGFAERGLRRQYYPTGQARREDAVIMACPLVLAEGQGREVADAAG
jgi:ribosomal-protein-alanine N-acetyltransferase